MNDVLEYRQAEENWPLDRDTLVDVELLPASSEAHLSAMVACLQESFGLQPEPYSKFERALALLDAHEGQAGA